MTRCWAEIRTYHHSDIVRLRYVFCHSRCFFLGNLKLTTYITYRFRYIAEKFINQVNVQNFVYLFCYLLKHVEQCVFTNLEYLFLVAKLLYN